MTLRPFVDDEPATGPSETAPAALLIETDDRDPVRPDAVTERAALIDGVLVAPRRSPLRRAAVRLFALGLLGLAAIGIGDWLIELAARHWLLAVAGGVFAAATLFGVGAWTASEWLAIRRLQRAAAVHDLVNLAVAADDRRALRALLRSAGERANAETALLERWSRMSADLPAVEMMADYEALVLAERDAAGLAVVRKAVRDTFGLVALSPTPITDTALFVGRAASMIRGIAEAYGHRPGKLATASLIRRVLRDVGIVVTSDLAIDAVAHASGGVLQKLAAAAGEGAIAGHRMARLGIVTLQVCRPVPFSQATRPRLKDLLRTATATDDPQARS
jgi:putative membrane protein